MSAEEQKLVESSSESTPSTEAPPSIDLSGVDLSQITTDSSGSLVEVKKVAKKDMELMDILKQYLESDKKEMPITPRVVLMFTRLLDANPESLKKIEELFATIMADKKINAKDIPSLILIIKELYRFFKTLFVRKISAEDCGTVLKVILFLLIQYRLDEDPETKELIRNEVVLVLDSVIGSCVDLIEFKEKIPKGILKRILFCI